VLPLSSRGSMLPKLAKRASETANFELVAWLAVDADGDNSVKATSKLMWT
jgi:hypothetical protein